MSRWLARETSTLGLPETVRQDLDVCANEAVMNVISHAFDGDGPHEILLSIARAPNELQLAIEDEGSPFNPLAHPEHAPPASLDDACVGGLGIKLIRRLVPNSHYERRGNRNVLTLIFPLA